jgi:CTP:molybdopterin cytidylyltransferase MocA
MISAVVLAAGRGDRANEQKLLVPLRDKPVLQWVLESALASDLHEIVYVVRDLETVPSRSLSLMSGYIGSRTLPPIRGKAAPLSQVSGPSI